MKVSEFHRKTTRQSMKIGDKCSPGRGGTIHFNPRTADRNGAAGGDSMKIVKQLVKLGAKGCPRRGTIDSDPRTAHRDDASYARFLVNLSKL